MIEFSRFTLKIEPGPVRYYLGYQDSLHLPKPVESLLIREIEQGYRLTEPKGGYVVFSVREKTRSSISFREADFTIESRGVLKALREAEKIVLFLVTIGPALEAKVKDYHRSRQITRSLILDAVGSVAVEELARQANSFLSKLGEKEGYCCSMRYSPGYGDWDISAQQDIFRLTDAGRLGVQLTDSCVMFPEKSISAVAGWSRKPYLKREAFPCGDCRIVRKCTTLKKCGG